MLHVISLGAGVQSTTMALMAAHGEITPMPDCAIFADTKNERGATYEHLRWLMSANVLPFPIKIVSAGNLKDEIIKASRGEKRNDSRPPFYLRNPDGSKGMLNRQCTSDYKIDVIRKTVREMIGLRRGQRGPKTPVVTQWIGISTDEVMRMKDSRMSYIQNRHPLIERGMNRWDCLRWLERHDYTQPPKSACTFCPFKSDNEWRLLRDHDPAGWAEAIEVDRAIRAPGYGRIRGEAFLHASLTPLEHADLSTAEDRGQINMFNSECEGMCGL